ncbi:OmpA family protein [Herbivorax sp. ANBcel31]|uniref:OmpA family protein n=1 Tax=Herbivorax sp. ANBcel31 TaxID=3069754 RepID=UPI0027B0F911|nr:OmpA family protein [Herbivorax sp. ANBcel31]MDQ2087121.1 OmpA family protein [Herbivorax sp. ANBcel31]
MKTRRRNFKSVDETPNFWPSFTDVMSTIALVLFFLMLLAYIQNMVTGNNLLHNILKLEEKQLELENVEHQLGLQKIELEETRAEADRIGNDLAISQREIDEQNEIIARSNLELEELRTKLEAIAVLRLDILEKVKQSIESELGRTTDSGEELVTIGENANIIINESLVFASNSYNIKPEGRELLEQFAIAFEKILDDRDIRSYIDSINIEGHTDEVGTPAYNRELSTKRSGEVVNYLMSSNPELERKYARYFATVGFSEFRPIALGSTETARQRNRRIEIKIAIKDSSIQDILDDYLYETSERLQSIQGDSYEE